MEKDIQEAIDKQRNRLFSSLSSPNIVEACTVGHGILKYAPVEIKKFQEVFVASNGSISFFIPASGVGSRMFDFLQQFLGSMGHEQGDEVRLFLSKIESFAFYHEVNEEWRQLLMDPSVDLLALCDYLLGSQGLNFSGTPKALFPFHRMHEKNASPLESHLRQGKTALKPIDSFHFTVQEEHLSQLSMARDTLLNSFPFNIDFSTQAVETDSYVFDEFMQPMSNQTGSFVRRPAGHGAILSNLNGLASDLVFIKNIDNIQCPVQDEHVNQTWGLLGGVLVSLRAKLLKAYSEKNMPEIMRICIDFQLLDESVGEMPWEEISTMLQRPFRVCGMVKNEGMPGGGPFWVSHEGIKTKQIIEKSQIDSIHLAKLTESSHFNPVMMAISPYDLMGNKLDLTEFVREDLSMAVKKNHLGKTVYYLEKPGLWNGSMYHWNTVFVEIPSNVFSPVKNVMDLLNPSHCC
jgi:hypothetical protein